MSDIPLVLFLDFDGVTHPVGCEVDRLFVKLPLIQDVLREFKAWKIVISSSWRVLHPLDEMREYFAADMRERVVGVTPQHPISRTGGSSVLSPGYERQWECETWLRRKAAWLPQHRRVDAPWVAIDDMDHWFRPGCGNLLRTNGNTGFCPDDALRMDAMLKERLL
jgi:hypothetical protein